ncbi:MAG: hypothetical protein IJU79_02670 [Desulfovibrionaceae bacterium]|nr:hypothetical protein [Desulfovibrionaceae bacterium]
MYYVDNNALTAKKSWEEVLTFKCYLTPDIYLANMYFDCGNNVSAKSALALKLLDFLGNSNRVVPAMLELARIYLDEEYDLQNFKKAAAKENSLDYSDLSLMNAKGLGVLKNLKCSKYYLKQAKVLANKVNNIILV